MSLLERLIIIVSFLAVFYFITKLLLRKMNRYNKRKQNQIFWDKRIIVLPIVMTLLFMILIICGLAFPSIVTNVEMSVFLVFPQTLGVYLFLRAINWKVEFRTSHFEYTNIFGKYFEYKYSEIKYLKTSMYGEIVMVGKHKITVDHVFMIGKDEFINRVDEKRIIRTYKPRHK